MKDKIVKSIKACSLQDKKCDECVCNSWIKEICQEMLFKQALAIIETLTEENNSLKSQLAETTDLARQLLYHIGG